MNTIQLDKPRKIQFNFNALAEYEHLTGKNSFLIDNMGATEVRALAYVGLQAADKEFNLSLEDVGELLDTEIMTKVVEALSHDLTKKKGTGK
jgi:hypothetical protein